MAAVTEELPVVKHPQAAQAPPQPGSPPSSASTLLEKEQLPDYMSFSLAVLLWGFGILASMILYDCAAALFGR